MKAADCIPLSISKLFHYDHDQLLYLAACDQSIEKMTNMNKNDVI